MNEETIYDIAELPNFAYTPGLTEWVLLVLGSVLALGAAAFARRRSRVHLADKSFALVCSEIDALSSATPEQLARLSRLVKRYLSLCSDPELPAMSKSELLALADKHRGNALERLVRQLAAIDDQRYLEAPPPPNPDLVQQLKLDLRDYHDSLRRVNAK